MNCGIGNIRLSRSHQCFAHDPHHKTVGIQHSRQKIKWGEAMGLHPQSCSLLVKYFVLCAEDDVEALSRVFRIRSERIDRLRCSHFV